MPARLFDSYVQATYEIEAQNLINLMQASDMPHMKDKERQKRFSEIKKIAYPFSQKQRREMTMDQLAAIISKGA